MRPHDHIDRMGILTFHASVSRVFVTIFDLAPYARINYTHKVCPYVLTACDVLMLIKLSQYDHIHYMGTRFVGVEFLYGP